MQLEGTVGPQVLSDGAVAPARQDRSGSLVIVDGHAKYYEANYRGNLFHACMTTGVIFPAPAATASNPFTLSNPVGSGKNLVLCSMDMIVTVIPGTPLTGLYGIYTNNNAVAAAPTGTALT